LELLLIAFYNQSSGWGTQHAANIACGILSGTNGGGYLRFSTSPDGNTAPAERLRITATGLVGIGVTSPASLLTSYAGNVSTLGAKASTGLLIENNGSVGNVSQIGLGYTFSSTNHPIAIAAVTTSGAGSTRADLVFATRDLTTDVAPTERARIDSSGRLLVGTTTARSSGALGTGLHQVESATYAISQLFSNGTGADGSYIGLWKSRGGTVGSTTIVQSGDIVGGIYFGGADGTNLVTNAAITSVVDGTPGASDMPGRLVFSTTPTGASTPLERMRITSDAYVRLAFGTGGIQFNGDTAAANALDDYEEGTWTASITGGTFVSLVNGRYTKVGRQVFASLNPGVTAITGNLVISGLPFVAGVRSALVVATIAPTGVTYVPDFVDAAQMLVTATGTYSGGIVSTYFACVYEV
jgi:hypothetical protein